MSLRTILPCLLLLLLATVASAGTSQGYLVTLKVQHGSVQFDSATLLPKFESTSSLPDARAWQARILDASGTLIWSAKVPSPQMLSLGMPRDQALLMALRVPVPPSNATLQLLNSSGQVQLTVPLDAAFAKRAFAARQDFLHWLKQTPTHAAVSVAAQAEASRYIARQQAHIQQHKQRAQITPRDCSVAGMTYVPELAGTQHPCVVSPQRAATAHAVIPATLPEQRALSPQIQPSGQPTPMSVATTTALAHANTTASTAATVVLTGTVTNASSGVAMQGVAVYAFIAGQGGSSNGNTTNNQGQYSLTLQSGQEYTIRAYFDHYQTASFEIGPLTQNAQHDIVMAYGRVLSGSITDKDSGAALQGSIAAFLPGDTGSSLVAGTDAQGHYSLTVAPNQAYRIGAYAQDDHYKDTSFELASSAQDTSHDFKLARQALLLGNVREASGGAIVANAMIRVLDTSNHTLTQDQADANGAYSVIVPRNQRVLVEAGRSGETWPEPVAIDVANADIHQDLYDATRYAVSITAKGPQGNPLVSGRVEIWQNGQYILGGLANTSGVFSLTLPAGNFVARVRPGQYGFQSNDGTNLYLFGSGMAATSFTVSGTTAVNVNMLPSAVAKMTMLSNFLSSTPYADTKGQRFELLAGGKVVAATDNYGDYVYVGSGNTQHLQLSADVYAQAGQSYQFRIITPGFPAKTSAPFTANNNVTINGLDYTADAWKWSGVLSDPSGNPAANVAVHLYNGAMVSLDGSTTDANGNFSVRPCTGCTYVFDTPTSGVSVRHVETLDTVSGSFVRDVQLDAPLAFHPQTVTNQQLQLLYGPATGNRYDILFLSEGYTANNESFTDSNGNGVWDGVLYYDLNQNSVWDWGEPWVNYGNAAPLGYSDSGSNPSTNNEPFNDANGDGVLNIGERQLFFSNARDYLRALLGSDYWREHRDIFRAWTYLATSNQAGMDVTIPVDNQIITRDTFLDADLNTQRSLLSVDYTHASQLAATELPTYDTIVVLINQPIPAGRENSFVLAEGGLHASPNNVVPEHEFGHKVGGLGDEYDEFGGILTDGTQWPDMTRSLAFGLVPWRDLLPMGFDNSQPTVAGLPGIGLFQGGALEGGGVYRSMYNSIMRYNTPRFAPNQKRAIDTRVRPLVVIFQDGFDGN